MKRLVASLTLAAVLCLGLGCTTNPATGQKQFNVLSESEEIHLGEEAAPQFTEDYGGELPSEPVVQYVRDLGHRLAAVSERPNLPWEFHVVDSAVINAFALPGGKVFISRGLLADLDNEAQLAGVLGHEVGHVTAQHIGQQMSQALGIQLGLAALGVAASYSDEDWLRVLGVGGSIGGSVYLLSYGRSQETQSDELGLRYMTRLGYNPIGQLQVMQILKRASGGNGGLEILSTHPLPQTRIDHLEQVIQSRYPDYDDPSKYRLNRDRFHREVLDRLEQLPPAKHGSKETQATQG